MLTGSTFSFTGCPTRLKGLRQAVQNQNAAVGLRSTGDHIGDKVAMARRVEDAEVSVWCREVLRGDLDGHTTLLLLLRLVHEVSESKASLSIELCFALIGIKLVIRECAVLEQDLAAERALAAIDMADNDQVQVVLLFFRCLDHLVV